MATPITTTTDEDDIIYRFLSAAEKRVYHYENRIPLNAREARAALSWLKGLVGNLNEDGSHKP